MLLRILFMLIAFSGIHGAGLGQIATFNPIGQKDTSLTDFTSDGETFVGSWGGGPPFFIWTKTGGYQSIGGDASGNVAISDDGSTIAATCEDNNGWDTAALWEGGTSWRTLGGIGGHSGPHQSITYDVSGDGTKVVGRAWINGNITHAFQWTEATGMVDLGSLGGSYSSATGISTDGTTVVGYDVGPTGWMRAAKWVNGVEELIDPTGAAGSAWGCNSDGSIIVGESHPQWSHYGWVWSEEDDRFQALKPLSGHLAFPLDLSDDGRIIVGYTGSFSFAWAAVWTEDGKLSLLKEYLLDRGATGLQGWELRIVFAISDDGTLLCGRGTNPSGKMEGWYATIPPQPTLLKADALAISARDGGVVKFTLDANHDQGNRDYFILGSIDGIEPGTPLPGGVVLPLNWDGFTEIIIRLANSPAALNFNGTLDNAGKASALLDTQGPLPASAIGVPMYFAYLLYYPFDFVSNPVTIQVVP